MNKIDEIAAALREQLRSGRYRIRSRFPSEYELAEEFGVHKITANKAVTLLVHEGLLARGPRGAGTVVVHTKIFPKGQIAFIGNVMHNYDTRILAGAQRTALRHDYLLSVIAPPFDELGQYLAQLPGSAVKGIVTINYGIIQLPGIPVIHIDNDQEGASPGIHVLNCDNYAGGRMMMEAIIAAGHHEIALWSSSNAPHRRARLRGFLDVLAEHGVTDGSRRVCFCPHNFDGRPPEYEMGQQLHRIRQHYPGLTIIATDSDDDALLLIQYLEKWAEKFPDFPVITGFGNLAGISDVFHMATIDQHPVQLGNVACERLIDTIEGRLPELPLREQLDVELVNKHYITPPGRNPPAVVS